MEKKLTSAMRYSVEGQTRAFRRTHERVPCGDCGTHSSLTVDHVNHFEGLSYEFLLLHSDHPTLFSEDR